MNYQNFDLEIIAAQGGQRLCARVLESPQGDSAFIDLQWPFEAEEENKLLGEMYGGLRQRHARLGRMSTIQDFGGKLFDAVFTGDIKHLYRSSLDTALHAGKGLRVRLRLPEESDLHSKPWEYLFDTESGEFLAVSEHTPLVRYLPVAQPLAPITVEGPLRVLVALAAPTDYPRLDIAREWEILRHALEPPLTAGQIELRRVPGRCTFDNLRDSLRHFGAHIFHFVGHGIPGALVLEQESGKGLEMEASHLRSVFSRGALPRLIVLNACSGALSEDAPLSGLAQGFLKQGVPAVVAMQAPITDDAALIFTRYFYRELVETGAVDASLTEARLRMKGNGHPIEWGTAVLYMRALSGQIFQPGPHPGEATIPVETQPRESVPPQSLAPVLSEQTTLPDTARQEHTLPSRLEPILNEELDPWYAHWNAFSPQAAPTEKSDRRLPFYWLAAGLPVLVLLIAFAVYKTLYVHESGPAPIPVPVPAPALSPAMPGQAELSRADARPDNEAQPVQESKPASHAGKPARPAAGKTQAARKAAPSKPANNCRNPDVSERSVECVFR